jgi:hypothetical protein
LELFVLLLSFFGLFDFRVLFKDFVSPEKAHQEKLTGKSSPGKAHQEKLTRKSSPGKAHQEKLTWKSTPYKKICIHIKKVS